MILICVVMAGFFLFTDVMKENLFGTKRVVFIIVLLMYALFRTYRLILVLREQKEDSK
ncbi:MAG: hypothetical protein LW688_05120 [Cryomorphaceae bacterium]|jgi:hypothetical protein|nr:hypothetical protein [Cryomorphaceae bacterium]